MKKLLALFLTAGSAFAADVQVNYETFTGLVLPGRLVELTYVQNRAINGIVLVSPEPVQQYTDTNGITTFTNVLGGWYDLILESSRPAKYRLLVPTNDSLYSAAALVTNATPPVSTNTYLTTTTGDARYYPLLTNPSNYSTGNFLAGSNVTFRAAGAGTNYIDASGGSGSTSIVSSNNNTILVSSNAGPNFALAINPAAVATVAGLTMVSNQLVATGVTSTNYYGLFGYVFKGGDGWPPTVNDQQARAVFSADGSQFSGGIGLPSVWGISGTVRDPALWDFGGNYALSYTTNAPTSAGNIPGSVGVPIFQSANLMHWFFKTNLTFALTGESLVLASNFCWSPIWYADGSNVFLLATVSTNAGNSFEIRYRSTTTNDIVNGWGNGVRLNNQTGRTNIIDLTPFRDDDGILYGWYKNETTKYLEQGRFDSDLTSAFRPVMTNDSGGWGANCEGVWMVKLPNGKYRVFFTRYQGKNYGNNGDGQTLLYAESDSPTNWPASGGQPVLTNVLIGFYAQSFKPMVLRTPKSVWDAMSATMPGMTLKGRVNIEPEARTGISKFGYASQPGTGTVDTNDYAGINFGHGDWGSGIFGRGDGSLSGYVRGGASDTNLMLRSYGKTVFEARTNRFDFYSQPYFNGAPLLTNSGGSVPANIVTNPYVGNLTLSNTAVNTPNIEMWNSLAAGSFSGQLASYIKMKVVEQSQGWGMGLVPGAGGVSNWLTFQLSESPYTHVLTLHTNARVGINTYTPSDTLQVNGGITASNYTGNGSGLTNLSTNGSPSLAANIAANTAGLTLVSNQSLAISNRLESGKFAKLDDSTIITNAAGMDMGAGAVVARVAVGGSFTNVAIGNLVSVEVNTGDITGAKIPASSITSGTLDVARYAVTNGVVATSQSYALVMHGTNPPAFVSTLTNLTLVSPTNTSVYIVPGGSISFGAYIDSTISSNATGVLVLGNGRLYIDASGHIRKASGRNFYWGGAGSLPYDVDSSATVITYGSRHVTNSLSAGNTITATNGFINPPLVCTTPTTNWSGQGLIVTTTNTTVFMSITGQEGKRFTVMRSPLNTAAGGQASLFITNGSFYYHGTDTYSTNYAVPLSGNGSFNVYGTNAIQEL